MEKALIYARVSTKEQAEEGYSLGSQIKLLRQYEANQQLHVVKEFVVPESASGHQERKTFKEMMDYCKKYHVNHILCEKVDRITRNLQDAVCIDAWLQVDADRRIHFVKQNLVIHQNAKSYEKFQWDIYVVLARQYSNNLSEETKKGLVEKAEEGWYPGRAKRGYVTVGNRGHKVWEIDPSDSSDAAFIARAFELYAQGNYTIAQVRDLLFNEGWTTSAGKKIAKSKIHLILQDPFYCGKFIWNGQEYEGKHEPLISAELYDVVQRNLKRVFRKGRPKKHSFVYRGLLHCAGCGGGVTAEIQKGHVYYRCTRYKPCTQKKCTREETITDQILNALSALTIRELPVIAWLRDVLKEAHEAEKSYHVSVMKTFTEQLKKIKVRIDLLYDDRADQRIDEQLFDRKLAQYTRQQEDVIKKMSRHKGAAIRYAKTASDIIEVSQRARELFERLEDEDKRGLFKFVLVDPLLDNGRLLFSYQRPFDKVHEIGTFQPQKSLVNKAQSDLVGVGSRSLLPQQDISSNHQTVMKLFQEWFGILEFPATFAQTAELWANRLLKDNNTEQIAA